MKQRHSLALGFAQKNSFSKLAFERAAMAPALPALRVLLNVKHGLSLGKTGVWRGFPHCYQSRQAH
jgi:hypothetical protein